MASTDCSSPKASRSTDVLLVCPCLFLADHGGSYLKSWGRTTSVRANGPVHLFTMFTLRVQWDIVNEACRGALEQSHDNPGTTHTRDSNRRIGTNYGARCPCASA